MATFINGHLHIDLSKAPPYNASTIQFTQDATLQPITTNSTNQSNDSSRSACNAVLHTTELLEQILLQLPIIDILTCTQTSKFFLNLIESSKAIRAHLLDPDTPMYTLLSYGKHIPIPETWLHRTSLAAGNVKRTHFIMDVDEGKMVVYDSGRNAPVYAFIPNDGNFVKILEEKEMEVRRTWKWYAGGSVILEDAEGKNVVCSKDLRAYTGDQMNVDPNGVIWDYFLGVQGRREGNGKDLKGSRAGRSENVQVRTSKRKKIVRALLRRARRGR